MKYAVFCFLWLLASSVAAQDASEIWLFDVAESDGTWTLNNGRNVSQHPGYDNQPYFHPSEPQLFFSSFDDEGRSDIKQHNFGSGQTTRFTETSEREYSPTVTPDGKFVSCIIQRDDGAQDLGQFPVAGGGPTVLIDDLIVGYHAWMDDQRLLLFVLGDVMTLRVYDLEAGTNRILAENPGRSLHRIPEQSAMSFVDKQTDDRWIIKRVDNQSLEISEVADTLPGREDLAWTPDGKILMSDGTALFLLNPDDHAGWQTVVIDQAGLTEITRLAVSPDGRRVAIVAAE